MQVTPRSHTAKTQLTCPATKLQLGEVAVGQTRDSLITITNSGTTRLIVLSAASTGSEFGLNGLDLPLTLAAGESFTFGVTFAPQRSGRVDGSISIVSEAPNQALTIQLSGTGRATGQLQVTPAAIDFGDASVGSTGTQNVQLIARGADVTVSSATTSSTNFQLNGPAFPFTIPAGHSIPFTVTFVPRGSDSSSAILSFASDAENSPTEQAVTVRMVGPRSAQGSPIVEGEHFQTCRWIQPISRQSKARAIREDQSFSGSKHKLHRPACGGRLHILLRR